ncbi:MAG: hypothetical protein GX802_02290 [Clostridiales bacterium]|nr:hypothetical protein [Clostridiales bacterium]
MLNQQKLDDVFKNPATSNYDKYLVSKNYNTSVNSTKHHPFLYLEKDLVKEYCKFLNETFQYDIFEEEDSIVIKLHIDYLKHNTTVAFPTVLFVTKKITEFDYKITSKHNSSIIEGTAKVEHYKE